MPLVNKLVRSLVTEDYPFQHRDFPTTLITMETDCHCAEGEHSFTTIAVTELESATLERRKCMCAGCFECEVGEVRVLPHEASGGRRHSESAAAATD